VLNLLGVLRTEYVTEDVLRVTLVAVPLFTSGFVEN
jgi:hypothetical protein